MARGRWFVGLVAALALAGCSAQPEDAAVAMVRGYAATLKGTLSEAARGVPSADLDASIRAAVTEGGHVVILGTDPSPDGLAVDVTLFARAETGGGLWYKSSSVRACARYTIAADTSDVSLANLACPPGAPTSTGTVGTVSSTVEVVGR